MKRWSLVVVLSVLLTLTLIGASASQSILVRIDADGSAFNPSTSAGGPIPYKPSESKTIDSTTQLVVFSYTGKKPESFLKKMNGKWVLAPWQSRPSSTPGAKKPASITSSDALEVYVGADGKVTQVKDLAGAQPNLPAAFLKALNAATPTDGAVALVSPGTHHCWRYCGGGWCCLCSNCPWGCVH